MMNHPSKFSTCLIDGDKLVMSAAFAAQRSEKGKVVSVDPVEYALSNVKKMLVSLKKTIPADTYRIFVGNPDIKHFRYSVAQTKVYKENRQKQERPKHEMAVRQYLIDYHNAEVITGVEVDDALGIEQCKSICDLDSCTSNKGKDFDCRTLGNPSIICSSDKDLQMIPGWHFDMDWGKIRSMGESEYRMKSYMRTSTYFITDPGFLSLRVNGKKKKLVGGGQLWFCAQLLMGDSVDNIPGLPLNARGCYGDVTTYNALKDIRSYKEGISLCWDLYKEHLKDSLTLEQIRDRFKEVAQLCWIKRAPKEKIFPGEWLL